MNWWAYIIEELLQLAASAMNGSGIDSRNNSPTTIPRHPFGVKPSGNAYTSTENIKIAAGYFYHLPDEIVTSVLEYLDPEALLSLGCTCKALYAFSRLEDFWKTLFILYVWRIVSMCHACI